MGRAAPQVRPQPARPQSGRSQARGKGSGVVIPTWRRRSRRRKRCAWWPPWCLPALSSALQSGKLSAYGSTNSSRTKVPQYAHGSQMHVAFTSSPALQCLAHSSYLFGRRAVWRGQACSTNGGVWIAMRVVRERNTRNGFLQVSIGARARVHRVSLGVAGTHSFVGSRPWPQMASMRPLLFSAGSV